MTQGKTVLLKVNGDTKGEPDSPFSLVPFRAAWEAIGEQSQGSEWAQGDKGQEG